MEEDCAEVVEKRFADAFDRPKLYQIEVGLKEVHDVVPGDTERAAARAWMTG